jgi:hypothetical protein
MMCCVCENPILPTENRTSINDAHYHAACFDRQEARQKRDRIGRRP